MQYYARAYKKDNCDKNIIRMEEYMKSHLYSPMQKDDDLASVSIAKLRLYSLLLINESIHLIQEVVLKMEKEILFPL